MSTKFVSKQSNYMIVLKPGVEGSRALGTHAISGLYVKFQGGIVDVKEESIIEMLRNHPSFGIDFLEVKENETDPYKDAREGVEPDHIMSELKYGHVEKTTGNIPKIKITPQIKKLIEDEALKMLPGLLKENPKILKDIIVGLATDMKKETQVGSESIVKENIVEDITKRGPGRPPKIVE